MSIQKQTYVLILALFIAGLQPSCTSTKDTNTAWAIVMIITAGLAAPFIVQMMDSPGSSSGGSSRCSSCGGTGRVAQGQLANGNQVMGTCSACGGSGSTS